MLMAVTAKYSGDGVGKPWYGLAGAENDQFDLVLKNVLWLSNREDASIESQISGKSRNPVSWRQLSRSVAGTDSTPNL